jgi:O-antigen/teichoic acid export membrane protein
MERINLKYFARNILESELIRNTTVLITGTIFAQLISILLQPFLRRFFSPEAFGTFSVYLSLVSILAVITPLRYNDAVVLPKNDSDSANVLFLSQILNFFISFILFLIIVFFGKKLIIALNIPEDLPVSILYLIPLSIFLLNTYQSFNYWLIRHKKYYAVTTNKLVRRGTEGVAQVTYAILKYPKGLIYSDIIGQIANMFVTIYSSIRSGFRMSFLNRKDLSKVMREYSDFPKYNLIPGILSACSYYLPTIFINKLYSPEMTGYFDLSKLLLSIPLAFIATSVSNVLLQRTSEKFRKNQSFIGDLKPLFYIIISICVVEIAAILLFSSEIFSIAFGKNWQTSADISRLLVWSFAFNFFVSSFSCIFISMQRIKTYSIWQFIYFTAIISLLLFRGLSFNDFIKIFVMLEVGCYIILTFIMIWIVNRYEISIRKTGNTNL